MKGKPMTLREWRDTPEGRRLTRAFHDVELCAKSSTLENRACQGWHELLERSLKTIQSVTEQIRRPV